MASLTVLDISKKTILDAQFRVLMAYQVVDVYEMSAGGNIISSTSCGPVPDNYKAVHAGTM